MNMLKISTFLLVLVALLVTVQLCVGCSHKKPCYSGPKITFFNKTYVNYIKTSCNATTYPKLCYRSLSVFADKIKTNPKALAHTALNVSLAATKTTSLVLNILSKTRDLNPTESAALRDCVELVDDSSYELQRCMSEMRQLRSENFAFGINNILTWASAALTNGVTCLDGFEESGMDEDHVVKDTVLRRGKKVCRLTSNALALVNSFASGQG